MSATSRKRAGGLFLEYGEKGGRVQRRVVTNALFATAFSLALAFGPREELRVYLAVTVGVAAVLFNIRGMGGVGFVVAAVSMGILLRFCEPRGIVAIVYALVMIGGVLRMGDVPVEKRERL